MVWYLADSLPRDPFYVSGTGLPANHLDSLAVLLRGLQPHLLGLPPFDLIRLILDLAKLLYYPGQDFLIAHAQVRCVCV